MGLLEFLFPKTKSKNDNILKLQKENEKLLAENRNLRSENNKLRTSKEIPMKLVDKNIESAIIEYIKRAKKEIIIAVAWISSKDIVYSLERSVAKGVKVEVITSDEPTNEWLIKEKPLKNLTVISKPGRNRMHNKFCIIDNKTLINGSYNWSENAKHNIENVLIIESKVASRLFKDYFYRIKNNPSQYGDYRIVK